MAEKLNAVLDEQIAHNELLGQKGSDTAVAAKVSAVRLTLMTVVLTLVGILSFWIARAIALPLRQVVAAAALAQRNLALQIAVASKDEMGQIKAAFRAMIAKLAHVTGEVRSSADTLSAASAEISATAQSMRQSSLHRLAFLPLGPVPEDAPGRNIPTPKSDRDDGVVAATPQSSDLRIERLRQASTCTQERQGNSGSPCRDARLRAIKKSTGTSTRTRNSE